MHLDPLISVVPVGTTAATAEVWVGSLAHWNAPPAETRIQYAEHGSNHWTTKPVTRQAADWHWALPSVKAGWHRVVKLTNLTPGKAYEVRFGRMTNGELSVGGQCFFETQPTALPPAGKTPFTALVASCFYNDEDNKQASAAYQALYKHQKHRPQLKFLVGDQVYADIGIPVFPLNSARTQQRFLDAYRDNWSALSGLLRRGVNVFLPDDHELYNDYPFEPPLLSNIVALRDDAYRRRWTRTAKACLQNIAHLSPVRVLSVGTDLSFCAVDLRSQRTETTLLPAKNLKQLETWAAQLTTPGVLVLSQLLTRGKGRAHDHTLADFPTQYQQLVKMLGAARHDIVLLAGDVHFGRIASVPLNGSGSRLIEVVSSPLSNLTGIYSISTSGGDQQPERFPPIPVPGVPKQRITYHRSAKSTGADPFDYIRTRTHEHFVTVGFNKQVSGVKMTVDAWRVRQNTGALPARAYTTWATTLN